MAGAEIDRAKQDAFGVATSDRTFRLCAPQSPRPAQDREESQHWLVREEQPGGVGWEVL
jgi:hypothetical protein